LIHQARKRFGQNFLQDVQIIDRMVNALRLDAADKVVEVGPGLGALTLPLISHLDQLHVVEIDRDLIEKLKRRQLAGLHIHGEDVLGFDFRGLATDNRLRIVGNLPYNIGTPLLLRLLECHDALRDVHVMLQKEVVDRLSAKPNTRAFGRLSVLMQSVFAIEPLFTVPAEAFSPAPKVQSSVVRLTPLADPADAGLIAALQVCTRIAFSAKRKTLRNNLKGYLDDDALSKIGIDPQARAETLDLHAFHRLANLLGHT